MTRAPDYADIAARAAARGIMVTAAGVQEIAGMLATPPTDTMEQREAISDAAEMLGRYANFIRTVRADDLEMHPYLPEIERIQADLLALTTSPRIEQVEAMQDAIERFLADFDDNDRADAGVSPLMELHVADFRAALATASPPPVEQGEERAREVLLAELVPLVEKASGPNGWDWMFPLKVKPVDGKPTIVSHKGGNLFRGYIGTWKEADLLVALANAAPRILAALATEASAYPRKLDLRPMADAPRDRSPILALYNPPEDHREARFRGRWFVIFHEGMTEGGYDMGWALHPGYGGVSDSNFAGWLPLPGGE